MNKTNLIRFFVMDIDGTLTDGSINISAGGELFKSFNVKDGYGISVLLKKKNIEPVIITGRSSAIVEKRAKELGISKVQQGVNNKVSALKAVTNNFTEVAYIGDDLNDLPVILEVKATGGITGCPEDASLEVRNEVDYISNKKGGHGAVREFIEWLTLD